MSLNELLSTTGTAAQKPWLNITANSIDVVDSKTVNQSVTGNSAVTGNLTAGAITTAGLTVGVTSLTPAYAEVLNIPLTTAGGSVVAPAQVISLKLFKLGRSVTVRTGGSGAFTIAGAQTTFSAPAGTIPVGFRPQDTARSHMGVSNAAFWAPTAAPALGFPPLLGKIEFATDGSFVISATDYGTAFQIDAGVNFWNASETTWLTAA